MKRLLERDAPLGQLGALARRVGHGAGRVVLLRGEAGVGKTAVVDRFATGLDSTVHVLRGWCDPLAAPRPLGPLIDALAGLDRAAAAALGGAVDAGHSAAIYRQLVDALGGGQRWVWVIEDAHWADGATLDLLRFLSRRIGSLALLLVVTYRDDEVGPQHPLAAAIGDMATCAAVTRIRLDPLSRHAVAVLAAGSALNATELHALTGGNAFYVTEILAAGTDTLRAGGLPRSVAEAVWGRLARLTDGGRDTAYAAAVCGPRAEVALVENICPAAATGLRECLHAGVLVADGAVVAFRHELARSAALAQMPDYRRRPLHTRALAALAQPEAAPDRLAALAFHADQAGDDDAAVRYGIAGAQRAAALGANLEATELYALALRHAHSTPAAEKVVWLEGHAFAGYVSNSVDTAESCLREAIQMRRALGDRLNEAEDLRLLSHMLWAQGRTSEAFEAGRASLRLLDDLGPTPQLARTLAHMVHLTAVSYDPACARYSARAIALGTKIGDPAVVVRAQFFAALAAVLSDGASWDECEATWRAAMANPGLAEHVGLIGSGLCWTAALHHDIDRAQRYITELSTYCDQHDVIGFQPMAVSTDALVALHRGDWAVACARADDVLTRPGVAHVNVVMALVTQALVRARRGDKRAGSLLAAAAEDAGPAEFFFFGAVWAARAEIAWLAGDDKTAASEAQRALAAGCRCADPWLTGLLQRWLHLAGAPNDVARVAQPLTPYQLEISGNWQAAAAEWTRRGCPYDAAIAQLGGDITAVQFAMATFRRMGARAAARRAQQRLTALGAPKPRGSASDTKTDPDGLTRRERQVLDLLAAGHRDPDIAATLHLSPRTVAHHVASILAKLGVDNRVQAATHMLQRQSVVEL